LELAQRVADRRGAAAVGRVLAQQPADELLEPLGDAVEQVAQPRRLGAHLPAEHLGGRGRPEGRSSGEGGDEEAAQGVEVGGGGEGPAGHLLRGHVGGGADGLPVRPVVGGGGGAEVDEDDVVVGEDDVGGFDVAVDDAAAVGGVEDVRQAGGDLHRDGRGQRSVPQHRRQVASRQQLHDVEDGLPVLP